MMTVPLTTRQPSPAPRPPLLQHLLSRYHSAGLAFAEATTRRRVLRPSARRIAVERQLVEGGGWL